MTTSSEEANMLLARLLEDIEPILEGEFVGAYLYGSLAAGGFDPATSDIDLVVVTERVLEPQKRADLDEVHRRLFESGVPLCTEIEGTYIDRKSFSKYVAEKTFCYRIDRGSGSLNHEKLDVDWIINLYSLQNLGAVLKGPPIKALVEAISVLELKQAVLELLDFWWVPMVDDSSKLKNAGYRLYAILTMCRMMYTSETGNVVSKAAAASWAKDRFPIFSELIEQASNRNPEADVNATRALIRFTRSFVGRAEH